MCPVMRERRRTSVVQLAHGLLCTPFRIMQNPSCFRVVFCTYSRARNFDVDEVRKFGSFTTSPAELARQCIHLAIELALQCFSLQM